MPRKKRMPQAARTDQNIGVHDVPNPEAHVKRSSWDARLGSRQVLPMLEVRGDKPGMREWTYRNDTRTGPVPDIISPPRSLRDDPLARLHQRKQISDIQFEAGRGYQSVYEASQGVGLHSSGDIKEYVDSPWRDTDYSADLRIKAIKRLAELDAALGKRGKTMVRDVLVDGLTTAQMALKHGEIPNSNTLKFLGRSFRTYLDTLAGELGLA